MRCGAVRREGPLWVQVLFLKVQRRDRTGGQQRGSKQQRLTGPREAPPGTPAAVPAALVDSLRSSIL